MDLPKLKLFLHQKSGLKALWGPTSGNPTALEEDATIQSNDPVESIEFSSDGSLIALSNKSMGVVVKQTEDGKEVCRLNRIGIQAMCFSPKNTFLLTWQRPEKSQSEGNLIVWKLSNGEIESRFYQKTFSKQMWPSVQWSQDEVIAAQMISNGIHIHDGKNLSAGIVSKIELPAVASFQVAPSSAPYRISTFVSEKKGKPANVRIYEFPNVSMPIASKSFYKAQEVKMKWSSTGNGLIIETSTDVDTSGKSYYGETGLYYLSGDGEKSVNIPLTKEGSVHDVQWDPTGRGFVVLAGPMPCNATLYDHSANPIFEFGAAPRNCISWSPHGRFLCLAGFGNLRGDMDFWDRNKLKKMGSCNANSSTCYGWSPDSRYFVTATTFPRLRVDNGYKVFKYNGEGPIATGSSDELYSCAFRPSISSVYPNRPQSPKRKGDKQDSSTTETKSNIPPPPAPVQAYRPPRSSGALAAMLRREEGPSKKIERNAYKPSNSAFGHSTIPGLAPPNPSGGNTKKKNRKKKKAQNEAVTVAQEAIQNATQGKQPKAEESSTSKSSESVVIDLSSLSLEEKQKKMKNLQKKLKQIETLKAKNLSELNEDQKIKLATEKQIQKELQQLQQT